MQYATNQTRNSVAHPFSFWSFWLSALGSFTCATYHTGPAFCLAQGHRYQDCIRHFVLFRARHKCTVLLFLLCLLSFICRRDINVAVDVIIGANGGAFLAHRIKSGGCQVRHSLGLFFMVYSNATFSVYNGIGKSITCIALPSKIEDCLSAWFWIRRKYLWRGRLANKTQVLMAESSVWGFKYRSEWGFKYRSRH